MPRIDILNQEYYSCPFPKFCIKDCIIARDCSSAVPSDSVSQVPWNDFSNDVDKALEQVTKGKLFARCWLTLSCFIFLFFLILTVASALLDNDFSPSLWTDHRQYISYSLIGIAISIQILVYIHTHNCCKRAFEEVVKVCEHHSTIGIKFSIGSEYRRYLKSLVHKPSMNKHYFITVGITGNDDDEEMVLTSTTQPNTYQSPNDPITISIAQTSVQNSQTPATSQTEPLFTERPANDGSPTCQRRDLRDRLIELEGIKDLVNEEEYESKRREILSEI
jgi:hypothetical protein